MIIIEPCAGLGNKLLGMSSAYAVAQKLNRELIVMWKREVGCNVKAEELFDLPFRVIEISENGYSKEPVAHFRGNQLKKKWRAKADRFLECGDVEAIKKQKGYEGLLAVIEKEPVIYIKPCLFKAERGYSAKGRTAVFTAWRKDGGGACQTYRSHRGDRQQSAVAVCG